MKSSAAKPHRYSLALLVLKRSAVFTSIHIGDSRVSKRCACNFAAALIALLISSAAIVTAAESGAPEYAIKATYLYKFGPFVRWPDNAFAAAASPFNICLAGSD